MAPGRASGAVVAAAVALVALTARPLPAAARPKGRKGLPIRVESRPSNATIYLDSKDTEPLGQTPYDGKLPPGSHTIIVELDGYVALVQEIVVKNKPSVQKFSFKLNRLEKGSIEVMPSRAKAQVEGARVFVDGNEIGNLPDTIKVDAGPHQVEVKKEGYRTFETWVEVQEGQVTRVTAELVAGAGGDSGGGDGGGGGGRGRHKKVAAANDADGDEGGGDDAVDGDGGGRDDGGDDDGGDGGEDAAIVGAAGAGALRPLPVFTAVAGFEIGGRSYQFKNPTLGNLRPYSAGGVPVVRLSGEIAPLAFLPSRIASGWLLYGSWARALPLESQAKLASDPNKTVYVPTTWREWDLGVGYRLRFGPGRASYLGGLVGYGAHTFTFSYDAESEELKNEIPDVAYRFISLALDGRLTFGRFGVLLTAGPRLVNDTGRIKKNFAQVSVVAYGVTGGVAATITHSIEARLTGRFDQYSETFKPQDVDPRYMAEGGTDRFYGVMLSAVFSH